MGVSVFLFVVVVVLMGRMQKLKRTLREERALPVLAAEDEDALKKLRAFGSILGDHGWKVDWNPPERYERWGTLHLQRGSFHSDFPDPAGEEIDLGVDALTFTENATLPDTAAFPMEKWRDLHPLQSFEGDRAQFPVQVKRAARTYFIFYQYNKAEPTKVPDQFEAFLTGNSRQRALFRRELADAFRAQEERLKALRTMQEAWQEAALYEGEIDGVNGWRTKHAMQRFLRQQGHYSGDIDGVFGNRTLKALHAFRAEAGLEKSNAMDAALAKAVVEALRPPEPEETSLPNTAITP